MHRYTGVVLVQHLFLGVDREASSTHISFLTLIISGGKFFSLNGFGVGEQDGLDGPRPPPWPVLKGCGCKVCGAASANKKADDSVAAELCHRLGGPVHPAALRISLRDSIWK